MQERNDRSYSLGNEADKKKIQASGAVRGVSLIRCAFVLLETLFFCVRVVFFFLFVFYEVL